MRLAFNGFLAGIIAFTLTACAAPGPVVQEVKIPVSVPCKIPPTERPAFAVDTLPIGAGIWSQMRALRAERWQRIGYEVELEAAVQACQ